MCGGIIDFTAYVRAVYCLRGIWRKRQFCRRWYQLFLIPEQRHINMNFIAAGCICCKYHMKGNKQKNSRTKHMSLRTLKRMGVGVYDSGVYVELGAVIERGAVLYAPCYISGGCHICSGAYIFPYSYLKDTYVGGNTVVRSSTLISAHVGSDAVIGPYSYLREGADIGDNCRIGDFVEVKASAIGSGTKVAHLAYVGDAEVGSNVNVGCGVVFANYDGKAKHKTTVGDGCFIGCNCNIVAPVTIKDGAYIAAGTTLTHDLEQGDFCIARCKERVKPHGADGRYKNG